MHREKSSRSIHFVWDWTWNFLHWKLFSMMSMLYLSTWERESAMWLIEPTLNEFINVDKVLCIRLVSTSINSFILQLDKESFIYIDNGPVQLEQRHIRSQLTSSTKQVVMRVLGVRGEAHQRVQPRADSILLLQYERVHTVLVWSAQGPRGDVFGRLDVEFAVLRRRLRF